MKIRTLLSVLFAFAFVFSSAQVMLKDIYPNGGSSYPMRFIKAGDYVFFVARDGNDNFELWKTDGTQGGTAMIKDINPVEDACADYNWGDPFSLPLYAIGTEVLFFANDYIHGGSYGSQMEVRWGLI